MPARIFAFFGVPGLQSDADISVLLERLENKYKRHEIAVSFNRKDKILMARLDGTGFYISFIQEKDIPDWCQLAQDCELDFEKRPINKEELTHRYNKIKNTKSNPYKKIHFSVGLMIIEEMEKFKEVDIYSFQ